MYFKIFCWGKSLLILQYLLSRKKLSSTGGIPQYDTDEDTAIFKMWAAHQAAIDVAKPKFSDV